MANTQSAIKRIRSAERKRIRNRIRRGRARSAVKKARVLAAEHSPETPAAIRQAFSELDRAAGKGVIHKNTAARRKSRLLKALTNL